jgi:hypothetical protein
VDWAITPIHDYFVKAERTPLIKFLAEEYPRMFTFSELDYLINKLNQQEEGDFQKEF